MYGTAIPLALLHAGAWSLIVGYFAWQGFLLIGSFAFSGYRPRLNWSTSSVVGFVKDGSPFAGAQGLERLGGVVNAMVVGTFAGAAGVGLVSFAMRLVDTIGFAARGTYRLGLVALSKVSDGQHERLRFALEEGCLIQLLTLALPFIVFGMAAHWIVPLVFGHEWTAAIPIYAVLALATTLSAPSLIFSVFLLTRGRYLQVCISGAIAIAILASTAIPLVRWLGPVGFAWASVLALADTIYLDRYVRRTSQIQLPGPCHIRRRSRTGHCAAPVPAAVRLCGTGSFGPADHRSLPARRTVTHRRPLTFGSGQDMNPRRSIHTDQAAPEIWSRDSGREAFVLTLAAQL